MENNADPRERISPANFTTRIEFVGDALAREAVLNYAKFLQPDSSGLPAGLLDQRFQRWVRMPIDFN